MLRKKIINTKANGYEKILAFAFLVGVSMSCNKADINNNTIDKEGYQVEIKDSPGFNYLLFMPANKSAAINGKYPTILFLHGIGERGTDLQQLKNEGLPKILDGDTNFPFIVIAPQCPLSTEWYYDNENNVGKMTELLTDAVKRFPVDTTRIYITGLSMGGIGTWYYAINLPDRFAAMAPVAFRGDGWSPCPAKKIPAWGFHGKLDNTIPLSAAQNIVDQFKSCGGNIEFTVYPDLSHDCWTRTYNRQDLYTWFLKYSK